MKFISFTYENKNSFGVVKEDTVIDLTHYIDGVTDLREAIRKEKLNELSPDINNLKKNINNENYENSISIIDSLFDKLGEISGTEEFTNKLDDLSSLLDSEEIDVNQILNESSEIFMLFDKEVKWRKDAAKNLMPQLEEYNLVIKDNIGLRLQSRLTKDQAKYVARCNSIHRDISLNF